MKEEVKEVLKSLNETFGHDGDMWNFANNELYDVSSELEELNKKYTDVCEDEDVDPDESLIDLLEEAKNAADNLNNYLEDIDSLVDQLLEE